MANNYTQWSTEFHYTTDEQRDWFKNELATAKDEDGDLLYVCHSALDEKIKSFWLYEDVDGGDTGALVNIVCAFQKKFKTADHFQLEYANICDHPRVGEFGGGAILCYRGKVYEQDSSAWLYRAKRRLKIK